jgi:serine/threonine-protein kinase
MNNHFLSFCAGKYEVIRTLGSGSYSTVYLVRHQVLELEQAIKVIPKARSDQLSVLSEARLLKSIHHPGIPMIYDIDEDDQYFYLVEEYIHGESLETFLLNQPVISTNLFFSICRQLCDIFIYLHTFMPFPVLYQDLKPEHIIVCGDQIKLIDFGVSGSASNSGNNIKHFGNETFSAPENSAGKTLSTAADVYSLGKLIQLLSWHVEPHISRTVSKIIQKSIHSDPAFRYETVEALQSDLENEFLKLRSTHLVQKIAVVGSHQGCGVTHISIALTSTLNLLFGNCYYIERNNTDSMRRLSSVNRSMYEKEGCFYLQCFRGYPKYGPGISVTCPRDAVLIADFGSTTSDSAIEQADLILFICDDAPWHWKDALDQNDFLHSHRDILRIIVNPGIRRSAHFYAKSLGIPVCSYFADSDAFSVTPRKINYFRRLLDLKGRHTLCLAFKRFLPSHPRR